MPRNRLDKQRILALYLEEENALLNIFDSLKELEMNHPEIFFTSRHKIRQNLKVINAIIVNLLALVP